MRFGLIFTCTVCISVFGARAQSTGEQTQTSQQANTRTGKSAKNHPTAKHDLGSGAGDIGKGAGKGVGSAAKGTGKAAGDLVTLHPVGAATNLGKGAVGAGKNVGVGTVKGTGKIVRGTGKALRHLF